jgi:hypothetical protein
LAGPDDDESRHSSGFVRCGFHALNRSIAVELGG